MKVKQSQGLMLADAPDTNNVGSSQTWLFQTWLFAVYTRERSVCAKQYLAFVDFCIILWTRVLFFCAHLRLFVLFARV